MLFLGEKWPKSGSKFEKMAQKNLIGENGGERQINPSANPALAVCWTENKTLSYSLTIFAFLVNIIQCCLTSGVSDFPTKVTCITFFMLRNPQCIKLNNDL